MKNLSGTNYFGWVALVSCVILITFSIWINVGFARPSIQELTANKSAAFQGKNISDPLMLPQEKEITIFEDKESVIPVMVDIEADQFTIDFLYQNPEGAVITLSIWSKEKKWIPFLVEHPELHKLNWFYANDNGYLIYQKDFKYTKLSEVFTHIPLNQILLEQRVEKVLNNFPAGSINYVDNNPDWSEYSAVILTRYPYGKLGDWYKYRKTIRVTEAFRETDGTVYLRLTSTQVPVKIAKQHIK